GVGGFPCHECAVPGRTEGTGSCRQPAVSGVSGRLPEILTPVASRPERDVTHRTSCPVCRICYLLLLSITSGKEVAHGNGYQARLGCRSIEQGLPAGIHGRRDGHGQNPLPLPRRGHYCRLGSRLG